MTKLTRIKFHQQQLFERYSYLLEIIDLTSRGYMLEGHVIEFMSYVGLQPDTVKSYLRELQQGKLIDKIFIESLQQTLVVLKRQGVAYVRGIDYKSCPNVYKDNQSSDIQVIKNQMKTDAILTLPVIVWQDAVKKSGTKDIAPLIKQRLTAYSCTLHLKKDEVYTVYKTLKKAHYYYATCIASVKGRANIKNAVISDVEEVLYAQYLHDIETNTLTHYNQFIHALVDPTQDISTTTHSKEELHTLRSLERFEVHVAYANSKKITYVVLDTNNLLAIKRMEDLYKKMLHHSRLAGFEQFSIIWYTRTRERAEYLHQELDIRYNKNPHKAYTEGRLLKHHLEVTCPLTSCVYKYVGARKSVATSEKSNQTSQKDNEVRPVSVDNTLKEAARKCVGEEF